MKKYILLLFSLIIASSSMAKIKTHAMIITLKDGTRDTLFLYDCKDLRLYGLEEATDDDYVQLDMVLPSKDKSSIQLTYKITPYGKDIATESGIIVDTEPINTTAPLSYRNGYVVFPSFNNSYYQYKDGITFNMPHSTTYYARAWCRVDGNMYFSKEQTIRTPRLCGAVCQGKQSYTLGEGLYMVYDFSSFITANKNLFGDIPTAAAHETIADILVSMQRDNADSEMTGLRTKADSIDVCDDGEVIYFSKLDVAWADSIRNKILAQGNDSFYVQASLSHLLSEVSYKTLFGYYATQPVIQTCDEKWGVRDNCYLTTPPTSTTAVPQVALYLDHIMLPGKKYNIRLIIAPKTTDEEPTEKTLNFCVYLTDGNGNSLNSDTFPTVTNNMLYNNGEKFDVSRDGAAINLEYTPSRFTYSHAIMLRHTVSIFTSANRSKYEQSFRIVGVEVTPAE